MSNHAHGSTCKCMTNICSQTLSEMDFSRGIWAAAVNGDVEEVQKYFKRRLCPDVVDSAGYTALHYAARNGHFVVSQMLLTSGANPNSLTPAGHASPLHRAAYGGHAEIVKLLIEYGAILDLVDSDGQTALHKAAQKSQEDVVKILTLEMKTLISLKDKWLRLPIDYVAKTNTTLRLLLQPEMATLSA